MSIYHLIWMLSCTLGATVAWIIVRSQGISAARSALAIGAAVVAFALGATAEYRLEHYSFGEAMLTTPGALFSSGHHLPLGLLAGAATAAVGAVVLSLPWSPLADGLAIGACVTTALGRIGCMVNGCCTGVPCSRFLSPLCPRYGPGSDPYGLQLAHREIEAGAPFSLPVHPLPLYFLVASLLIGVASLLLRRRGARPGSVAWLFALAYPAAQFALEPLRARAIGSDWLNQPLLAAMLVVTALGFAGGRLVRRSGTRPTAGWTRASVIPASARPPRRSS